MVSFINSLMQLYPECDVNMSGWKINGPLAKYDIRDSLKTMPHQGVGLKNPLYY